MEFIPVKAAFDEVGHGAELGQIVRADEAVAVGLRQARAGLDLVENISELVNEWHGSFWVIARREAPKQSQIKGLLRRCSAPPRNDICVIKTLILHG